MWTKKKGELKMKFSEFKNALTFEDLIGLFDNSSQERCNYCPLKEQCWKATEENPEDDRSCEQYMRDTLEEG